MPRNDFLPALTSLLRRRYSLEQTATQSRYSFRSLRGSSIGGASQHIKFMGKFMIDDIMTLLRVATGVQDGVPYKDERPLLEGLSDNGVGDVCGGKSNFKMTKRSLGGNDGRGVDQDGQDVPVKFMRQAEKKEACLGGYRHTDFVGQFKPAATFPCFSARNIWMRAFSRVCSAVSSMQ